MATVSYLVTSYNKAAYLLGVLASVERERAETGGEIIIIDDGSTDGSERICAEFAARVRETTYLHQPNAGVYPTYNRIAVLARGKWIRFCDSDDPLTPGSTARLLEAALRHGAPVAYGRAVPYGPEPLAMGRLDEARPPRGEDRLLPDTLMRMISGMDFTTSRAIYRADAVKAVFPLPEHLISCQDFAMALPMATRFPFVFVDEPVCFYLSGAENQLSYRASLTWHQTLRILQHHGGTLHGRSRRRAITRAFRFAKFWRRKHESPLAYQFDKAWLYGLSVATKLRLCDWDKAFDIFAARYEAELAPIIQKRQRPF
jgi:glycosyltransferase involved in cell wall biosynthesis